MNDIRPELPTPFPSMPEIWVCPKTGFRVPKLLNANLDYRAKLLARAENDPGMQDDLMWACSESFLFWINAFTWTYHQFDVAVGQRIQSRSSHVPFITWEVQHSLCNLLLKCLEDAEDILVNKSRDMGASWLILAFMHWLWQFRPDSQLLEISRTEDYVDKTGNMKALFQRHDYINRWQPEWMTPPDVLPGQKQRTKMHMQNQLNGSCIDGESTTEHAASGDRRLVIMLDEFAKVTKNASMIRSATRDAALMRIVNSTVVGPGTEYSKWKHSGKIKVFPLMWWDHPDKGLGRYVKQDEVTRAWKIRAPWYDHEETVRSPSEMAREIDADDIEAGSTFFNGSGVDSHKALFVRDPDSRWNIDMAGSVPNDDMSRILRQKQVSKINVSRHPKGKLRWWGKLIKGRPDQTKGYCFGIDLSRGQGASNSVVSIKCEQTGEKVGEWRDAMTPQYEMPRVMSALALWVGGKKGLPYVTWEMNGPGWDFGKILVKDFHYPYYYRNTKAGIVRDKASRSYGWHNHKGSKNELLTAYERALSHGGFINHSNWALDEAKIYVYFPDGSIGPAVMIEENKSARETHGDCVIADALANKGSGRKATEKGDGQRQPMSSTNMRCAAGRLHALKQKRRELKKTVRFDLR